jgi:outer membrane protein
LYQHALECTPEVRQAESNLRAKEFHLEAEKGESLPKMEIISQYALFSRTNNYQDFFNRFTRNNFIIGLSLQVPLFNGYRTGARVAQSRQEVAEARSRLEHIKSELKLNIQRGLSARRIAQGELDLRHINVQTAREMVEVNQTLLEGGRISPKEMEDSRSQLHQSELAQLEADRTLFQRELDLLRTVGSIQSAVQ